MPSWTDKGSYNNRQRTPQLKDQIDMLVPKPGEWGHYRCVGPSHSVAEYWIELFKNNGETVRIRKLATNYDPATGQFKGKDPYADLLGLSPRIRVYQNVIDRAEQDKAPKKQGELSKSERKGREIDGVTYRIKDKDSGSWTPVRGAAWPSSAAGKVQDITALNKVKDKKTGETKVYGPDHPKNGFDVAMIYDKNKSPADQYNFQKEEKTPLTEEEIGYPLQDIWLEKPESYEEALKNAQGMVGRVVVRDKDDKIINSPSAGGADAGGKGGKKKGDKKPDYLGDLDGDGDIEGGKKKGKGKKDKTPEPEDEPDEPPKKDKGKKKDKAPEPEPEKGKKGGKKKEAEPDPEPPKGKKDKGGKAKADPEPEKGKSKKDKGGKKSALDL